MNFTFNDTILDESCGIRGWCQFEWSVTSDKELGVFSYTSNVTTFELVSAANFINTSIFNYNDINVDWGCDASSLWTLEVEPWSRLEIGSLLLSNFNETAYIEQVTSGEDSEAASPCDAIYRRIDNITGQGSG